MKCDTAGAAMTRIAHGAYRASWGATTPVAGRPILPPATLSETTAVKLPDPPYAALFGGIGDYREHWTREQMIAYGRACAEAALSAPAAEPVVWIQPDHLQKARKAPFLCRVEDRKRDDFVPLYAEPVARKPLTKEQVDFILGDSFLAANGSVYSTRVYDFVRQVERAHRIE